MVELRKTLLLSVDDLLCVVHEFVNPECSRSSLIPQDGTEDEAPKSFKDYLPG